MRLRFTSKSREERRFEDAVNDALPKGPYTAAAGSPITTGNFLAVVVPHNLQVKDLASVGVVHGYLYDGTWALNCSWMAALDDTNVTVTFKNLGTQTATPNLRFMIWVATQ